MFHFGNRSPVVQLKRVYIDSLIAWVIPTLGLPGLFIFNVSYSQVVEGHWHRLPEASILPDILQIIQDFRIASGIWISIRHNESGSPSLLLNWKMTTIHHAGLYAREWNESKQNIPFSLVYYQTLPDFELVFCFSWLPKMFVTHCSRSFHLS